MGFINFKTGTKAEYDALQNKNPDTLYFIEDEQVIIKDEIEYCKGSSENLGIEIAVIGASESDTLFYELQNSDISGSQILTNYIDNSRLPSDYIELEYIESAGSQYIDTNYKPTQDARIIVEAIFPVSPDGFLIGAWDNSDVKGTSIYANGYGYRNDYGSDYNQIITGVSANTFTVFEKNKNQLTIAGKTVTSPEATFVCNQTLTLFARNTDKGVDYFTAYGTKIKRATIFDNGILIRDFVPCKNINNNEIGLYDLVESKFYNNNGTESFIAGPEIKTSHYLIKIPLYYGIWNFYLMKNGIKSNIISLNIDTLKRYYIEPIFYNIYGVKIQINASDPATAVTYIEDAEGMTPGWDNWKDKSIFKDIKPCILRNGEVVKYLQRDNYTKYEDGTTSNLTTLGDDVMVEIPKIGYKMTTDGSYHYIYVTNEPNKEGFCYAAHSKNSEGDCDKIYIGTYLGYNDSSKLYSSSGKTPMSNVTLADSRTYANVRGTGYELFSFYPLTLLQCLFLIIYKNRDGKSALGQGYIEGSISMNDKTGATNYNTFCYGSTSTTTHVKFLGIEDFWGNSECFLDGIRTDASRNIHTWYRNFESIDSDSNYQYNVVGPSSDQSGYMKNIVGTNHGGFCNKESSSSYTTYWACGGILFANSGSICGGRGIVGADSGPFLIFINISTSNNSALARSARLLYKHLAS